MMALMSALLVVDAAVVTSCTVADGGPALCVARGEAATASEAVACGGLLLALLLLALCGPPATTVEVPSSLKFYGPISSGKVTATFICSDPTKMPSNNSFDSACRTVHKVSLFNF